MIIVLGRVGYGNITFVTAIAHATITIGHNFWVDGDTWHVLRYSKALVLVTAK